MGMDSLSYMELFLVKLEKRMKLMFSARKCLQAHYKQPRELVSTTEQTPHSFIH